MDVEQCIAKACSFSLQNLNSMHLKVVRGILKCGRFGQESPHLDLLCVLSGNSMLLSQPREEIALEYCKLLLTSCTPYAGVHSTTASAGSICPQACPSACTNRLAGRDGENVSPAIKNCLFLSTSCVLKTSFSVNRAYHLRRHTAERQA